MRVAASGLRISRRHELNGTKSLASSAVTLPPACIRGIMGLKGTRTDSARTLAEGHFPRPRQGGSFLQSVSACCPLLLLKLIVDFPSLQPSLQAHDPARPHTQWSTNRRGNESFSFATLRPSTSE